MIGVSHHTTERAEFDALLASQKVVPVSRVLFADSDTPVSIYRKVAAGAPGTFLLESAEQGGVWTRFSFIGAGSFGVLTQRGDRAAWTSYGLAEERVAGTDLSAISPLDAVDAVIRRWSAPGIPGFPPLTGGLVGFIGWEAIRQLEDLPDQPPADYSVPGQALSFVSELIAIDHREGTVTLIANALNDDTDSSDDLWSDAQGRLDALQQKLTQPTETPVATADFSAVPQPTHRTEQQDFLDAVAVAQKHIVDGDIFQVVLSQRFDIECTADPLDVYRVLRHLNPSPYLYLLSLESDETGPYSIVGSSPEALVTVQNSHVITHPIAGSKPRGSTVEEDRALEHELKGDEKERAEHLMLVDLARNDLLRVCDSSSVEVTEFMRIERFSHIMHLVSTVEGSLRPDAGLVDAFRATFPAGTLSGAPKPRALQIIDDLEPAQRGVYGGVVGYFGLSGSADLAIAIRTATIVGNTAHVQAGGGIVADSVPRLEFEESQNKAAAPLRAVAIANTFSTLPIQSTDSSHTAEVR
ncbi:anthranilate synthase component I [Lysinibacter cavernae]|uniref:Anthranilate synthase component 1 n=1 Tax=Lysinibacter cavernae TaxID=1640652 RepID=A0A7X5QZW9_9MICO|nr:anthranilate synthase component I [Lysinibacter cavernae]NIH52862.1 anthranilate synthase component 1 [Lysinibacter cavernae]